MSTEQNSKNATWNRLTSWITYSKSSIFLIVVGLLLLNRGIEETPYNYWDFIQNYNILAATNIICGSFMLIAGFFLEKLNILIDLKPHNIDSQVL